MLKAIAPAHLGLELCSDLVEEFVKTRVLARGRIPHDTMGIHELNATSAKNRYETWATLDQGSAACCGSTRRSEVSSKDDRQVRKSSVEKQLRME